MDETMQSFSGQSRSVPNTLDEPARAVICGAQGEDEHDHELENQLCQYLQRLIDEVDDPGYLPVYLAGRTLTELYVEPEVYRNRRPRHTREKGRSACNGQMTAKPERHRWRAEIEEALSTDKSWRAIVLGMAGQGKSLLMEMTARQLALHALEMLRSQSSRTCPLPIPVRLSELAAIEPAVGEPKAVALRRALAALIRQRCSTDAELSKATDYIAQSAESRQTWLLLDGLDEVADPGKLRWVFSVLREWNCHVLLFSRPHAYQAIRLPFAVKEYHLAKFSQAQIADFSKRWFRSEEHRQRLNSILERGHSVRRLARDPYLLTLLCSLSERRKVPLDVHRGWFYEQILCDILGLPADGGFAANHQRAAAWIPLMADMMLKFLHEDGGGLIPTAWLLEYLGNTDGSRRPTVDELGSIETAKLTPQQQAEFLLDELRKKRLLIPVDAERSLYVPVHRSLVEYLAASSLADAIEGRRPNAKKTFQTESARPEVDDAWRILDRIAWHPKWENTIIFLAGMLRDPSQLLGLLSDARRDDYFRHQLALAVLCLDEIPTPVLERHEQLAMTIMVEFAERWWDTAVHGNIRPWYVRNWQRAIRTTARLDDGQISNGFRADVARRLEDPSEIERRSGITTAKILGPIAATPDILQGLASNLRGELTPFATAAVARIGPAAATPDILKGLLGNLGSKDQKPLVANAFASLGRAPTKQTEIVSRLRKLMRNPVAKVRNDAAEALGRFDIVEVITDLSDRVEAALKKTRGNSSRAMLGLVGTLLQPGFRAIARETQPPRQVSSAVIEAAKPFGRLLTHDNECLRVVGVWVLATTGLSATARRFKETLQGMLESERRSIQLLALDVIGIRGELLNERRFARHLLRLACEDCRAAFRLKFALSRFDVPAITAVWPEEWKESGVDESRRGRALEILNCLGKAGATPAVLDCLAEAVQWNGESASKEVLFQTLAVIRRMGPKANREDIVTNLGELAEHGKPWFRATASRTLIRVGVELSRPEVSEAMDRSTRNGTLEVRRATGEMKIRQQETELAGSIDNLTTELRSESKSGRRAASRRLAAMGPKACTPELLPDLMQSPSRSSGDYLDTWRGINRLMKEGLRIFCACDGAPWTASTIDDLSRIDEIATCTVENIMSDHRPEAVQLGGQHAVEIDFHDSLVSGTSRSPDAATPGRSPTKPVIVENGPSRGSEEEGTLAGKVEDLYSKNAKPCWIEAYVSRCLVIESGELDRKHTAAQAYMCVRKHDIYEAIGAKPAEDRFGLRFGEPPTEKNWIRYERHARGRLGEQKNKPRANRPTRVREGDIEASHQANGQTARGLTPDEILNKRVTKLRELLNDTWVAEDYERDEVWRNIGQLLEQLSTMNPEVQSMCKCREAASLVELLDREFPPVE